MSDSATESERRFIVRDHSIVAGAPWQLITQAYVFARDGFAIRVRTIEEPGDMEPNLIPITAAMTGKGPDHGFRASRKRQEFETSVEFDWAREVIARSGSVVRKRRYNVITDDTWEIDQFLDANEGLWIAELEGQDSIDRVPLPAWAEREVSKDDRYDNDYLSQHPWREWFDEA